MRGVLACLLTLSVFSTAIPILYAADGEPGTPTKIGIFAINVVGLDPGIEETAIDALATVVGGTQGLSVVTRTELNAMLGAEQLKEVLGCDDVSCMAEIGLAAGVDRVVAGSVSRVEKRLLVSLQLVNVRYANVENRVTLEWNGDLGSISNVLGAGAELLVMPASSRVPGGLLLVGIPQAAVVTVDGKPAGIGTTKVDALGVGVHSVHVEADGYQPQEAQFVVRQGVQTHLSLSLASVPDSPFYTKWWFWAGTAAVIGGGATAAVLLAGGNDHASGLRVVSSF